MRPGIRLGCRQGRGARQRLSSDSLENWSSDSGSHWSIGSHENGYCSPPTISWHAASGPRSPQSVPSWDPTLGPTPALSPRAFATQPASRRQRPPFYEHQDGDHPSAPRAGAHRSLLNMPNLPRCRPDRLSIRLSLGPRSGPLRRRSKGRFIAAGSVSLTTKRWCDVAATGHPDYRRVHLHATHQEGCPAPRTRRKRTACGLHQIGPPPTISRRTNA
jgi:hypothetical protein